MSRIDKSKIKFLLELFIFIIVSIFIIIINLKLNVGKISFLASLVISVWVFNLYFSIKKIKGRFIFFIFQITFFNFLMGEFFFSIIDKKDVNFKHDLLSLSIESYEHALLTLLLSLIAIFIGYNLFEENKRKNYIVEIINRKKLKDIYLASLLIFTLSFLSRVAILIEKSRFVGNMGYSEYYLSYSSNLPIIISFFSSFYHITFYSLLSTFPSRKKSRFILLLGVIVAVISLGYGQRNGFILDMISIFVYLVFREQTGRKWIDRRIIALIVLFLPLALGMLQDFSYQRLGKETIEKTVFEKAEDFFVAQGGSIHLITYGYQLKEYIPEQGVIYTLGPIKDYLTQNIIAQKLLGYENWQLNPLSRATKASLFGPTLSYMLFPIGYLKGAAMGSSYIAEIYHDFGYVGVIIVNILIGIFLRKADNFNASNWLEFTILIMLIKRIVYLPRDYALGWFPLVFAIPNILALFLIVLLSLVIKFIRKKT